MKTSMENAKATLEIYEKLEAGKTISVEEVETCWGFIADVYGGMEKKFEKILSLFRYSDSNIFKNILWIVVVKYDNLVYVGYETVKGDETEFSFERKFLGMSDKELEEYRQKSVQKMVISSVADIERTKIQLTAYKRSIENVDKRIEELKKKLKKKEKQGKINEEVDTEVISSLFYIFVSWLLWQHGRWEGKFNG